VIHDITGFDAQHTCGAISVVAEVMVDVAALEAQYTCDSNSMHLGYLLFRLLGWFLHLL
jgi:hypothetical protein